VAVAECVLGVLPWCQVNVAEGVPDVLPECQVNT